MPELLNGIRTALALSFILLVSSELIVARQGFGYLIGFLGGNGSFEGMFAGVLTAAFPLSLHLALIVALMVAWEVFARSGAVTMFVLPPLSLVLERIWNDAI